MSVDHYENFPVASWLCPPQLRPAIAALYHYARTADDIADEGQDPAEVRIARLREYRAGLMALWAGPRDGPDASATVSVGSPSTGPIPVRAEWRGIFEALGHAVAQHALPLQPLLDLLDAFEQDIRNPPYPDRASLLDYCRRSANPIGRLMLHLWRVEDERSGQESDAICSALQLINFWQDFSIDHRRGRCYVPHHDARAHGIDPGTLTAQSGPLGHPTQPEDAATQALIADLCTWARTLMLSGWNLPMRIPGRAGWELRLVVQGGLRILEKIEQMEYRSLHQRPRLRAWDIPVMLWRALWMQPQPHPTALP